jgi:ankyrin repeat protein
VRHINSPKYLKRFLPSALTSTSAATSEPVVEVQETRSIPEENKTQPSAETNDDEEPKDSNEAPEPESKPGNVDAAEAPEAKVNEVEAPEPTVNGAEADEVDGVEADEAKINGVEAVAASGDESMDSDDRSESEWTAPAEDSRELAAAEEAKLNHRYELEFPFYHIRMAQALWTPEERKASNEWEELTTLLENFFIKSPKIFDAWQEEVQGYTEKTKWTLIQSVCLTALPEIAEKVLSQGADIDEVTESCNLSPLHIATRINHGHALTRFLLDHGADPNRTADYSFSPFHSCLLGNPDLTLINEFFNHSGSRKPVSLTFSSFWGWTALHCLAYSCAEPLVLDLLLDNGADIDIRNTQDMTLLHLLLDRREIPLELLRAFIDRGANVTAEDNASESKPFSRLPLS